MLDTRIAKPLFVQLYDEIREQIEDGSLSPGTRLPAERLLADQNGISRDTARKAVLLLSEKGYVYSWHGKGAYILPRELQINRDTVTGFSEQQLARGKRVTSTTLRLELVDVDEVLSAAFGDTRLKRALYLERLRFVDGVPAALDRVYLRYPLCSGIRNVDLTRRSLYAVLEEVLDIRLRHVRDTLAQTAVTQQELDLLQVKSESALILRHRQTMDDEYVVVEVADSLCRIDYMRPTG